MADSYNDYVSSVFANAGIPNGVNSQTSAQNNTGMLSGSGGGSSGGGGNGGSGNSGGGSTYTPYQAGESDYARTARALNTYAQTGNRDAYLNAVTYAHNQGWNDMIPSVLPSTLAGSSSNPGIIPNATVTPGIIPTANQDMMKTLLQTLPTYTYQPQAYQQTIPDYSITGNKGDVTYIPTVKSKQLWNDTQNQNADNAYKAYSANINNWGQAAQQLQNAIINAQKERDYEQKTIADRAAEARQAVADKTAADKAAWERDPNNPDNILKLKQADYYDTRGGSSGGSGGLTSYQQYEMQRNSQNDDAKAQQWISNEAASRAKADPRLESGEFTYPQLVDAWTRQLIQDMYGGQ